MPFMGANPRWIDDAEEVGDNFLSNSCFVSWNLGSADHNDVNDGSKSIVVWTSREPGLASNWYFCCVDLMGKVEVPLSRGGMQTKTFRSIMIKLSDGLMLAIHGGLIRHGSTLPFPDGEEAFLQMNPYMKKQFGSQMVLAHPPKHKNTVYGVVWTSKQTIVDKYQESNSCVERDERM